MNDTILEVSDLNVSFQNQTILDNISFKADRGEMIAIVGPNGSGKSTLFKALLKLIPYEGKIVWKEKEKIGYVPQHITIGDLPISVEEFLSFKKRSKIEEVLLSVELKSKEILQKQLRVLSGGELQRVFIAWAVMDEPNVLLFDEPTSGVDIGSEDVVYDMLHRLQKTEGITIFLISHDLHIVERYADRVLALNRKLLYYGEPGELAKSDLLKMIFRDTSIQLEKNTARME
ncbi:MAG: metal ABC transporter ATP-binding protein [Candidatus Aminicenantes bacterium]|nr:metal ABC transporter ATP-binding protein [Candidatus Aminicenantes bacterium]